MHNPDGKYEVQSDQKENKLEQGWHISVMS
jgi:hypothetical protein